MERALKDSAVKPRQGQTVFLLPGTTEAEPWEAWIGDKALARCVKVFASPAENPWKKQSLMALPVSRVFCLPLWLNESDPALMPGMIELQLESRGYSDRGAHATVFQWEVVARGINRTLVLVGILPTTLPAELQVRGYQSFDVSARFLKFPPNAMTLWREQGALCVAFTRGTSLAYFQTLGEETLSDRALQTLTCIRESLQIQHVLENITSVETWVNLNPAESAGLERILALPAEPGQRPDPTSPAQPWNLCPPEVSKSRHEQKTRRWKSRALLLALAVYLAIAATFAVHYFVTAGKVRALRAWQAGNAVPLALVHQGESDWHYLAPVVDTDHYPLEVLLSCANAIPAKQLRMTLFEVDAGNVQIKGEANNVSVAYVFFDHLKSDPRLAAYTWKMDEPHLLPNDLAQLQIEGTLAQTHP